MADNKPNATVCGMPLELRDEDELATAQPISGVVVVKGFTQDGEVSYFVRATQGLTGVECLGMIRYAELKLENVLFLDDDDDDSEEDD